MFRQPLLVAVMVGVAVRALLHPDGVKIVIYCQGMYDAGSKARSADFYSPASGDLLF